MALPCGGRRAATLLHPPLSSSTLPQGRDVALKRYCSEPLKINERSGGMKGKRSPSVPGRSLLYCPDLGQGNFLLPAPHLEGCAEGFLVQDLSEVLLLIILEMPRAQVREHAFQRGGRASPQCTHGGGQWGRLRARAGTHHGQVGRRVTLPQQNSPAERGC